MENYLANIFKYAEQEKWYISIVDVIAVLTISIDPGAYWRKLKQRLKEEGNETVTNCHSLKMLAPDGKMRMTDVADTEQLQNGKKVVSPLNAKTALGIGNPKKKKDQ